MFRRKGGEEYAWLKCGAAVNSNSNFGNRKQTQRDHSQIRTRKIEAP